MGLEIENEKRMKKIFCGRGRGIWKKIFLFWAMRSRVLQDLKSAGAGECERYNRRIC